MKRRISLLVTVNYYVSSLSVEPYWIDLIYLLFYRNFSL